MIVECIIDTDFRGKPYKKGQQKNVTREVGAFMVSTEKWKALGGQVQTDHERKVMESIEANKSEPAPVPVTIVEKEEEPSTRRSRGKK